MVIYDRTYEAMLDSDATTGVGKRSGSTLNPQNMTAKERSALKKSIASKTKAAGVSTTTALTIAESAISAIQQGADAASAIQAAASAAATQAETDLTAAENAADAAKSGELAAKAAEDAARIQAELDALKKAQEAAEKAAADALKKLQEDAAKAAADADAKAKAAAEAAERAAAEAAAKAKAAQDEADAKAKEAEAKAKEAEAKAKAAQDAADKASAEAKEALDKAAAEAKAAAEKAAAEALAEKKRLEEEAERLRQEAIKAAAEAEAKVKAAEAAAAAIAASKNINTTGSTPITVAGPFDTVIGPASAADIAAAKQKEENAKLAKEEARQSVITTLTERFSRYGLQSLIPKIKDLAVIGATEATVSLQLQETEEYKTRFAANEERIKKGLQVLTAGEYLAAEDSYRQILRAYGLNEFATDAYVQKFIENDVSSSELSNRVATAVQRVQNADPTVLKTLKDYYGIGEADAVGYILDPNQQINKIERQVAAAEIGTAARIQGIEAGVGVAEQLAAQGISQAEARKGYATIADILPTAEKLSQIYGEVETTYGLAEAEQEVFNQLASAQRRREQLMKREMAQFSGQSGLGRTSLTSMDRGQF